MLNRELLDHLRALNAATIELRQPDLDASSREACCRRIDELRARLPVALLGHHDAIVEAGRESVAAVQDDACGGCGQKLPVGLLAEVNEPGRIAVCPHCGVFLFGVGESLRPQA